MMLNGGTLDGVQILSPKTVALFSLNYLPEGREVADMALPGMFSESAYAGVGFSLGCGVNVNVAKTRLPGSLGEYFWGGAAATAFWIDPKEELTRGVHDPGDRQRGTPDIAPGLAHAGLFGDDGVVLPWLDPNSLFAVTPRLLASRAHAVETKPRYGLSVQPSALPQMHSEQGGPQANGVRQRAGRTPACAPRCFPAAAHQGSAGSRKRCGTTGEHGRRWRCRAPG